MDQLNKAEEIARAIPINRMVSIPSHCILREKNPATEDRKRTVY